jgi:hypothetical protein
MVQPPPGHTQPKHPPGDPRPKPRRAVQICVSRSLRGWDYLYVLADDGTMWWREGRGEWNEVSPLPHRPWDDDRDVR